jgi:cytochrome P450
MGRVLDDRCLILTTADEMIRWVSPVKQCVRTATDDYVLSDVPIGAGEAVLLSCLSANRAEDVFDRPDVFDIGRSPTRHLAFGSGFHYRPGTHLARIEARVFSNDLLPRLRNDRARRSAACVRTLFVDSPKDLPIRDQRS